jgi:hypothetical protein
MKKLLDSFNLWAANNDDYIYMHKNHKVNKHTKATAGYKFMRNGWIAVGVIALLIHFACSFIN